MEEENAPTQIILEDARLLIQEIMGLIEQAKSIGSYRVTQKKECETLVWRLKQLIPLLGELRDVESSIPESGIRCLMMMKKAAKGSKKLLKTCHGDSRIYLVWFYILFSFFFSMFWCDSRLGTLWFLRFC